MDSPWRKKKTKGNWYGSATIRQFKIAFNSMNQQGVSFQPASREGSPENIQIPTYLTMSSKLITFVQQEAITATMRKPILSWVFIFQ